MFEQRGISVHDPKYLYDLPKELHRYSDYNGIHTNNSPLGKGWNKIWENLIEDNPNATVSDIETQLMKMEKEANLSSYRAKQNK